MTERQQIALSHFVENGYHPFGAAAIVGNGCGESGVNLDSTFERVNADHGSGGFLEWRDSNGAPRKTRLAGFCDARGPNLRDDLLTQCDYAIWELGKYFVSLDAQIRNPGTRPIENLTANFCWVFENPARATAGLGTLPMNGNPGTGRIGHAYDAYNTWMLSQSIAKVDAAKSATTEAPKIIVPATVPAAHAVLVDATNAGRQAAVLDQMHGMRDAYAAQIAMLQKEMAVVESAIGSFAVFLPPQTGQVPIDQISPEAIVASPTRKVSMFKNWQTTAAGAGSLLGAVAAILHSVSTGQMPDITQMSILFAAVSSGIGLLSAKDKNVTGGTVPATPEAVKRTGTPL